MIYLDNASTTLKKPISEYFAIFKAMLKFNANPGRSGHDLGTKAGFEVFKTREILANFFNAEANKIIFTSGCTESLNLAIRGTKKLGGHIITTIYEHNSVLRVLQHLQNKGEITFTALSPNEKTKKIEASDFEKAIQGNTYMIICNHVSNVVGQQQDIKAIGEIAKKHNLLFLVDSAQSAGHKRIDVQKYNISMLAFAGHKGLLGLSGVGGLVVNGNIKLLPIKFGGTGTSSNDLNQPTGYPESYESGTLPLINIISLQAGVKYVQKHFDTLNAKIENLTKMLIDYLHKNPKIMLYTKPDCYNGVVAFNVRNFSAMQVCDILNEKFKICVRGGLQCAPLVHKHFGTIKDGGMIRVSISHTNKSSEIKKLIKAIESLT